MNRVNVKFFDLLDFHESEFRYIPILIDLFEIGRNTSTGITHGNQVFMVEACDKLSGLRVVGLHGKLSSGDLHVGHHRG